MDPITRDTLAANAFRTLGLSGAATQSAVVAAARSMRLWPDPSRIPPTPFDLPELGPVRRSKPDIEQAVSLLNQPHSRLQHRLLWLLEKPNDGAGDDASIVSRHDRALRLLQTAWQPNQQPGWPKVIGELLSVFHSPELSAWLAEAETAGRFDKASSPQERAAALNAVPAAVAAGLVRGAASAFEQLGVEAVVSLVDAAAQVPDSGPIVRELVDRLEDVFNARANEVEYDLRQRLRTNHVEPEPFYEQNRRLVEPAAASFERQVKPAVAAIAHVAANDTGRLERVRSRAAELLILISLGWEWSGELKIAEDCLHNALAEAGGTATELQVHRELERLKHVIATRSTQRRKSLVSRVSGRQAAKSKSGWGRWSWLAIVASMALRGLMHLGDNSGSNSASNVNLRPTFTDIPRIAAPSRRKPFPDPNGVLIKPVTRPSFGENLHEP